MNTYKRLFCVLLVFVLLFVQFLPLHTVHATENNDNYGISLLNLDDDDYNGSNILIGSTIYFGNSGVPLIRPENNLYLEPILHTNAEFSANVSSKNFNEIIEQRIKFDTVDGSKMFSKNSKVTLEISGFDCAFSINDGSWYSILAKNPSLNYTSSLYVKNYKGDFKPCNGSVSLSRNSSGIAIIFTVDSLPCDAYGVWLGFKFNYADAFGNVPSSTDIVYVKNGFTNSTCSFTESEDDGTKGLLGNIIQIVTNIKDGVINLPSKIASSIKGFFDNVVNSIVNLGTTILDGIKGLFVPSEEDITEMKDRWEQLLSDRFGALYQTTELISDYAAAFTNQQKNTITMPSVSIPLADSEFVFGGWEVQVVPDGFTVVFDTLKLIISIVCTIWFVNGLKNRFEKLVGGANNI